MERAASVTLTANNISREFEISHAERILRMPDNGGWALPENSQYTFNVKDGITTKRDKGQAKASE